jgi:hypothetical protein
MRIYTRFERAFVSVIGALMLWSAPHWAADGLHLYPADGSRGAQFMILAALMVLIASMLLYVGVRGRAPRWTERFSLPRKRM